MKLKSEKGFTGTDITIALIIILLFISILSVVFFNITKSSKGIDRKSEATYVATNIMEAVKASQYDTIKVTNNTTRVTQSGQQIAYQAGDGTSVNLGTIDTIEDGYTCFIEIHNYIPEEDEGKEINDLVKVVTVRVEYKLANEIKNVELTTTIVRQK